MGDDSREEVSGGVRSSGSGECNRAESRHDGPPALNSVSLGELVLRLGVNGLGHGRFAAGPTDSGTRKAAKANFTGAFWNPGMVAVDADAESTAIAHRRSRAPFDPTGRPVFTPFRAHRALLCCCIDLRTKAQARNTHTTCSRLTTSKSRILV